MNKAIVFLEWMAVLACPLAAGAESEPVRQVWMQQHHDLKADIQAYQAGKRLASPHLLDRQTAVYKEDRFVCDIVLRRTAALLKDLQALPNAADLNGFEKELADLKKRCEKSTSDRHDLYLLDKFGNQELLFSASGSACGGIESIRSPIPLKARRRPSALPTMTNQGERYAAPDHERATIAIMNVYESDFEWPANTKISAIRVLQLFPYPWHSPWQDKPRVGPGDGVSARAVLGVVPVEDDGSAYFEAPVEKAIYFQALDQNAMAVQSMRSATYVHPGEQLTCLGCHEKKGQAPARNQVPMALKRPPSKLVPNLEDGSCPLTYARLVEPLLRNKCNKCHAKNNQPEPDLEKYQFFYHGTGGHSGLRPVHDGYRTEAGRFGAIETGLAKIMLMKHHREALTMAEINRITLWADANSNELGAYRDQDRQRAGEVVWPLIDMDPENPAGLDLVLGRPAPPTPSTSAPLMKQSEEFIKARWPDVQTMRQTRDKEAGK